MEQIQEDLNISEEQEEEHLEEEDEALVSADQSMGEEIGDEMNEEDIEGEEGEEAVMKSIDESVEAEASFEEEETHETSDIVGEGEPDSSTEILEAEKVSTSEQPMQDDHGVSEAEADPDNEPANSSIEEEEPSSEVNMEHQESGAPDPEPMSTDNEALADTVEPGPGEAEPGPGEAEPVVGELEPTSTVPFRAPEPVTSQGLPSISESENEEIPSHSEALSGDFEPITGDAEQATGNVEPDQGNAEQSVDEAESMMSHIEPSSSEIEPATFTSEPSTSSAGGVGVASEDVDQSEGSVVVKAPLHVALVQPMITSDTPATAEEPTVENPDMMFEPEKEMSNAGESSAMDVHQGLLEGIPSTSAEDPIPECEPGPSHRADSDTALQTDVVKDVIRSLPILDDITPESHLQQIADMPSTSSRSSEELERRLEEVSPASRPTGSTYIIKRPPVNPTKLVPQLSLPEPVKPRQYDQIVPQIQKKDAHETDDLATLAHAALTCDQASSDPKAAPEEPPKKEPVWCDVGIIKGSSCLVTSYYEPTFSHDQEHENMTIDNLPDFTNCFKIDLEPGTAYKFRVCAVNSCGRGPWSEVSAFKTCLPGYPGAPSSIKISKSAEGAHLSWEPPSNPAGNIIEYSVCLAVKNSSQGQLEPKGQQLAFVRVYSGPHNQTVVPNSSLNAAHIDTTSKPAIIFRIAAKNEKGFGPATQVRWLQDVVASPTGSVKPIMKKDAIPSGIPVKRSKLDDF